MTFKQLMDKYDFDDIVPELNEIWDMGNIYLFRQSLTILKSLEPASGSGVIEVYRVGSDSESYNRVSNLVGHHWHENLGWEIVVDSKCGITEKQLLALCLWERTFYGFSPEQQQDTFDQWDRELGSDSFDNNVLNEREILVADICSKYPTISAESLNFLISERNPIFLTFRGLHQSIAESVDYIIESIVKYSDLPTIEEISNCVLLLMTPEGLVVPPEAKEKLLDAVKCKVGFTPLQFHERITYDLKDLHLTVLYLE